MKSAIRERLEHRLRLVPVINATCDDLDVARQLSGKPVEALGIVGRIQLVESVEHGNGTAFGRDAGEEAPKKCRQLFEVLRNVLRELEFIVERQAKAPQRSSIGSCTMRK